MQTEVIERIVERLINAAEAYGRKPTQEHMNTLVTRKNALLNYIEEEEGNKCRKFLRDY